LFNEVANYTSQLWCGGRKTKKGTGGWITGNAVCCPHNGETTDTRGRGGLIVNTDGNVSWHCFNCQFTASYVTGRPLSIKFKKLLNWMGAPDGEIQRLVIEALRVKELFTPDQVLPEPEPINFTPQRLPKSASSFMELATVYELQDWKNVPKEFHTAVEYVGNRQINMQKYEFLWSDDTEQKLKYRVIIPFKYQKQTVGYMARAVNDGILPKYLSYFPPELVFNLDNQSYDNKFVIVCEGPFDAMSIDGVSVQHNEISLSQAEQIEALGKQIIVVPDFDKQIREKKKSKWSGQHLVDKAIEYGWGVSFPVWNETCKDINEAVCKYGKLFVLKAILAATETNKLKIELMKKRYAAK